MTSGSGDAQGPVRLFFEMSRDDNPRLYDDLIRFNKGTRRVNRLRFLAHEGLMAQHGLVSASGSALVPPASPGRGINHSAARHTNQAFDSPQDAER